MKVLLLDNYDSFTYNLRQLLEEAGAEEVVIRRNDDPEADFMEYEAIVLSPGPGLPAEAGILTDLIRRAGPEKKILGVCLGMQAIAEVFGGRLFQPGQILHGETAFVIPSEPFDILFKGIEKGFEAGLYHSWAVEDIHESSDLIVTSFDKRGIPMSLRHKQYNICGVQFHPESVMTPEGKRIIKNWLENQES